MALVLFMACLFATNGCDKLNFDSKDADYKLQERCSKSAKDFFQNKYQGRPLASYENHYNRKMNKCFILLIDPAFNTVQYLYDVNENKLYGSLYGSAGWYFLPEGNHDDVSSDKWYSLVKSYMKE